MNVFKSNGCHENFMNICLKAFLNKKHTIQKKVISAPRKSLLLALPSLGPLLLQPRTKIRKSLKGILNC